MTSIRGQGLSAMVAKACVLVTVLALLTSSAHADASDLTSDFYDQTCPEYKTILQDAITDALADNPLHAAGLSRIHFHDCFIQGCDASLLLNVSGEPTELDALPNSTLRPESIVLINDLKALLEIQCPGTVSCADLISLASAEATRQVNGPTVEVLLGRRDSLTGASNDTVLAGLPNPFQNVSDMIPIFNNIGLDYTDFVALSGAHTLGLARCGAFQNRLFPTVDPTMDSTLASTLIEECPENTTELIFVSLDDTPDVFDNDYFTKLVTGDSLLTSDASMLLDPNTNGTAAQYAESSDDFVAQFILSFLKMSEIGVLTGSDGEVRTTCTAPNAATSTF